MIPQNYIEPDIDFIRKIGKQSGASFKECMQCGACTVVCNLSTQENPFPRKEMIWTAWGLKEKLIGNPNLWLCHQCGDCSSYCPRGVDPANVLSSLRQINYEYYANPSFLARALNKIIFLPIVILFPAIIISIILFLAGTMQIPDGDVNYSLFFPHLHLNISFSIFVLLVAFGMVLSIKKFWSDIKNSMPGVRSYSLLKSFFFVIMIIFRHKQFSKCDTHKYHYWAHMAVFWGFILLIMVTLVAIANVLFFEYPMSIMHPAKITGNIAGVLLVVGISIMAYQRLINKKGTGKSTYFDWIFLVSLLLLTISGTITQLARFGNWSSAYHIYFFHLVCVWMVVIYAPYTKFGHIIYRIAAMTYAKSVGRL